MNKAFERLLGPSLDASALTLDPDAWGGYMDAGDWDRRSGHLRVGYLLMELLDLFPDYFAGSRSCPCRPTRPATTCPTS